MNAVVIGMDPHKQSATIEVMAGDEAVLGGGRLTQALPGTGRCSGRERTWATGGCQGIDRHLANRLIADGEQVVDVPPKLSARTRVFATGRAARPARPTRTPSRSPRLA
jgi:hypothetical protein